MNFGRLLRSAPTLWGLAGFLVVLAVWGPWIPTFVLTLLINLLLFASLAYSMNFIAGLTGYVSFGHVVFMGTGAYAWGYVVGTFGWHPLAGIVAGAAVGLVLALGIGSVALRFRGVYFAIATLVTALAARNIILVIPALGDGQGIILNLGFEPLTWFYTIWVILGIQVGLTYWVTHGRIGYGLRAIKSDEDAAKALGVDAARLKLFVFAFSGLFAGAAGALNVWTLSGVFPEPAFDLLFSLQMLAMVIIGGMGTLLGPLLGAVAVYLPHNYFLTVAVGAEFIVIGILVTFFALVVPQGIVGALRRYVPTLRGIIE
ncbi:MAG: branched-chain amino acid ABC transporter permease [Candidatus Eisenbacteria bacterium]|uniref:Branched-chain amino acid ABC transporter permease n=1 Tax=Eiseniibacteriota bacterium TaxID=2212470 RepID=A0A538S6R1_UNCEI|nr:MAG: branched-chain amino acid ABC transporter permease [Candidatus Eisenbacteria bacterium]